MAYTSADQALARLQGAHAALLKQSDLQFHIANPPPPKPDPFREWLGRMLHMLFDGLGKLLGPAAPYIFWPVAGVGLVVVIYLVAASWFGLRRGQVPGKFSLGGAETWRPAPEQARALLEEADRLAAEGLYEEAAHLILLRSIQDLESRRPRAVAPSLTSRDIAALKDLTPAARDTFSGIAAAVEQSLFGGRPMGGEGFARCRQAYEAFARAEAWA